MATGFFARSGPRELILCIFHCCESTHDLLSLALTCRRIHNIWQAHAAAVVWRLWLRKIPCFEDALTVVSTIHANFLSRHRTALTQHLRSV